MRTVLAALFVILSASHLPAASPVSKLRGECRHGQVFLQWDEADTPTGSSFSVYRADRPIARLADAQLIARHVEPHSARDWWEDPASFHKEKAAGEPVGFLLAAGGSRLDPRDGLFVDTVPASATRLYYAVCPVDAQGKIDPALAAGANVTAQPIAVQAAPIEPIWQRAGAPPALEATRDKPLWLNLHAKGGVVADMEYLYFGDARMGWRPGLPFKFSVRLEGGTLVVRPTDRVWINRPHNEAKDGGTPAIWTFWYGYNSRIDVRAEMAQGVPVNYTERRNLWMLDWVRRTFQPDANRWYCSGSSMGGCGTVSFGFRHPELFIGLHAHVPIVSYTYLGRGSAVRFEPSCWTGPIPDDLKTDEGVGLLARMNGTDFVRQASDDLPPLFLVNGRRDGSIPWENNPPFYRALDESKQFFAAYWDNGDHATCGKDAPADVKAWQQQFRQLFRRNESYPAFSHTSSNRNPGQGDPSDGDTIGWMNRGMSWREIDDTPQRYAITLAADYPGITYPVTTDVTLRRLQQFKPGPNTALSVRVGDGKPVSIQTDAAGRFTVPRVTIGSAKGVRLMVERGK